MAKAFPFGALPQRMTLLGVSIARGTDLLVRKAALGIGATVVNTTKVDTGRARSNWQATLNAPATEVIPAYAPGNHLGIGEKANANQARAQHSQVIDGFKSLKHRSIFITNNVHYIGLLNNGGGPHAPGMMIEQGIQTGRQIVRSTKVLDGR